MIEHTNSQGERISIEPRKMHGITPVLVLVIHDDPPAKGGSGTKAPMLLDAGTREWLKQQIAAIEAQEAVTP